MGMIPQHLKIKQHKELISHHPPLYCRDTISSATVWVSSLYVLHSPANISVIMRPADKKNDKHMIHEHTLAPKKHNARMTINAKHCNILRTFFFIAVYVLSSQNAINKNSTGSKPTQAQCHCCLFDYKQTLFQLHNTNRGTKS